MRLTAHVPATSANLGPGFDCFGLALDLCNEVTIDTEADPGVSWEGQGAHELPTDGTDLVSRAIRSVLDEAGAELEPLHLHGVNRIPLERGLGSSSAAAVGGVALARTLLGISGQADHRERIFHAAAVMEGHPDNAAPATFGGLTVVSDGRVRRFDVPDSISPIVLIPSIRLSTDAARRALPDHVPIRDAVYNVARGALTLHALTTGDLDLLHIGLRDRLHQSARLALVPEVRPVFEALDRSMPVCLSGAGPSILAFPGDPGALPDLGEGWSVLRLPVRPTGVEVLEA